MTPVMHDRLIEFSAFCIGSIVSIIVCCAIYNLLERATRRPRAALAARRQRAQQSRRTRLYNRQMLQIDADLAEPRCDAFLAHVAAITARENRVLDSATNRNTELEKVA